MELSIDTILSLFGLLGLGGGSGAFFTWKWMSRKAKAEAVTAEVDAAKNMQELYKKMIDHSNEYLEDSDRKLDAMRAERDKYHEERDEFRNSLEKLTKEVYDMKVEGQEERANLRADITSLKMQIEGMQPKTCIVDGCARRQVMEMTDQRRTKKTTK